VVGFDDIPESPFLTPPLTTVRQDFNELGSRGVRLLLSKIDAGGHTEAAPLVAPELIVRASTGSAPRS
jgi:DNA-binding LacI/PurR family transcriptional regulator